MVLFSTDFYRLKSGRHGGLMVSALVFGSSGPGCVVFLGKTLYSHSASLHPGVKLGNLAMD